MRLTLAVLALTLACAPSEDADPPMKTPPEDDGADGEDDGGETDVDERPPGEASDRCEGAPRVAEGRHYGTLRGNVSELAGACGMDGPDAFVRLDVTHRSDVFLEAFGVGFSPRVGVLPAGCSNDWNRRSLACTEGIGTWILDVAAGSSLVVSVGIDVDDPQLQLPPPGEGPDPLDFALDVALRPVLGVGERCEPPGRGRCGVGTACLVPDSEEGAPVPPAICTPVAADTCASAEPLVLTVGTTMVDVPRDQPHTDAHAHSCTGAHRPERVYEVTLPNSTQTRQLTVNTEAPDVGLAVRTPGCTLQDERLCDDPDDDGARVTVEVPAIADDRVFVFVELPPGEPTGEEAPIALELRVVEDE